MRLTLRICQETHLPFCSWPEYREWFFLYLLFYAQNSWTMLWLKHWVMSDERSSAPFTAAYVELILYGRVCSAIVSKAVGFSLCEVQTPRSQPEPQIQALGRDKALESNPVVYNTVLLRIALVPLRYPRLINGILYDALVYIGMMR